MNSESMVVLWIAGPPGVGKTTVAREIWSRMSAAGIPTAYVNVDQLGMSMPAPPGDPDRHGVKAAGLAAVVPGYRFAGARCLVMCGVVDTERAREHAAKVAGADVVLCQLRLDPDELRDRLRSRDWDDEQIASALNDAASLDRKAVGDIHIDTTGMSVTEVVGRVHEVLGGWPGTGVITPPEEEPMPATAAGSVTWLCGVTGVGKSTVGWQTFMQLLRQDTSAAFVDLEQIGFIESASTDGPIDHPLRAHNLAALWQSFHAGGARHLVVTGEVSEPDQLRRYREALPAAGMSVIRLDASLPQLRDRILKRGRGEGWRIPGDRLKGRDSTELNEIAESAAADALQLAEQGLGDLAIDTDHKSVTDIANTVLDAVTRSRDDSP